VLQWKRNKYRIKYFECMSVALGIPNAMRMRRIITTFYNFIS